MAKHPIVFPFASGTSNTFMPSDETSIKQGIALKSNIRSDLPNGLALLEQSAIRELQTMGGMYDNNQVYNAGDFVSQLISENGVFRIIYYRCKQDNTTQRPPLTGDNVGTQDIPVLSNITQEDLATWDRVFFETKNKVVFDDATQQKNIVVISAANKDNVFGKLKVRTKGASSNSWDVCFDIDFFGSASEFRISNVYYSRQTIGIHTRSLGNNIFVAYIGFCIDIQDNGEMHIWRYNTAISQIIEFDFSDLNCPVVPNLATLKMDKPYAIIEGGGVNRPRLGEIIYCFKEYNNNLAPASGETYDFYFWRNGWCVWHNTILDSKIYHQFNNGGFGRTNKDTSDMFIRNKGTNAGSWNGVEHSGAIKNISGEINLSTGWNGTFEYASGAFELKQGVGAYQLQSGGTNSYFKRVSFNANKVVATANEVRPKSFCATLVLQIF